jgi:hypothetical protein
MQSKEIKKDSSYNKERLEAAKKDFDKMMMVVSPFIKKRSIRVNSTSDGWIVTSEQKQQQLNK